MPNRGARRKRASEPNDTSWTARMIEEWNAQQKATKRAIRTFERQPGFASMQLWLRDRMGRGVSEEDTAAARHVGAVK
jgi:hypothetical protein